MFKRVKSLVLAGALVLGMAVPAFAEGESKTALQIVTEKYTGAMNIGSASDGIRTIEENVLINKKNWDDNFVGKINTKPNDGLHIVIPDSRDDNGPYTYIVYFDANFDGTLSNEEKTDANKIETINITFTNRRNEDKGIFDIISPETGDMIAYGGLGLAVIAGAGLYISNKKRK